MQGAVGCLICTLATNLPGNLPVKKICKSVKIWQNYGHESVAQFFGPPCMYVSMYELCMCNPALGYQRLINLYIYVDQYLLPAHRLWQVADVDRRDRQTPSHYRDCILHIVGTNWMIKVKTLLTGSKTLQTTDGEEVILTRCRKKT